MKHYQSNRETKNEYLQELEQQRRIVLDNIVYTTVDSLLEYNVSFKEFRRVVIPRLKDVFQILKEDKNRHNRQESEKWDRLATEAESDAAAEKER